MRSPRRRANTAASLILLVSCAWARADLTPENAAAAEECIRQFSAREFEVRQKAVEKLVAIGPEVVGLVKKVLDETGDNEVKLRCEMVLKGIREYYVVDVDDRVINVGPARITAGFAGVPLAKVLEQLAALSGNKLPEIRTPGLEAKLISLELQDVPYWEAMDRLRSAAGLLYGYDWSSRTIALYAGAPADDIGAYAGPCVVKLFSISRTLSALNGVNGKGLALSLVYAWESRLPVIYAVPVITKAATKDGVDLEVPAAAVLRGPWEINNALYGVSFGAGGDDARGPADMEGFVRLEFGIGEERFVTAVKETDTPMTVQGLTFSVTKVDRLERECRVTVEGKTEGLFPSFHTMSAKYGMFLCDPSGKLHAPERGACPYVAGGFNIELVYTVPNAPGDWSLVLVYPKVTKTRDYPFVLKEVPLP